MASTPATLFGLRRVAPMAVASRFRAIHSLFQHRDHNHDDNKNVLDLRHASAMSNAILMNMSTTLGEPSQLIDPSMAFEEDHRRYSFITVLAMMSLFILITVSIVALMLGFCRKQSTSPFALTCGHGKHRKAKKARAAANKASQFELGDMDMDLADVETKACRDDPGGACYYHLSDDDDDDEDDDDYDDDDDMHGYSEEDYVQIKNNQTHKEEKSKGKNKRQTRRQRRKRKLRFKDTGYYYQLHKDDDSDDEYSFDQSGCGANSDNNDSTMDIGVPKRSTTFPQLHNVLTSCIKGETPLEQHTGYQKLSTANSPNFQSSRTEMPIHCDTESASTPGGEARTTECKTAANSAQCVITGFQNNVKPEQSTPSTSSQCAKQPPSSDSPALLHPESSQLILVNNRSIHAKQRSVLAQTTRPGPSAFLPPTGRGRLVKSYSFHDIPRSRTTRKQQVRHRHIKYRPTANHTAGIPARPRNNQVTFKVGILGGDTDIRVHHPDVQRSEEGR